MMARQVRTTRTFYTDDSQIFLELTTDRSWADLELTRTACEWKRWGGVNRLRCGSGAIAPSASPCTNQLAGSYCR